MLTLSEVIKIMIRLKMRCSKKRSSYIFVKKEDRTTQKKTQGSLQKMEIVINS